MKMASTAPAKSQPLHNFSLPHLVWKNHRSGRNKLAGETSSSSPPPHGSPSTPLRESPPPISHNIPRPLRQSSPSYVSRWLSPLHKQSPMRDFESESERIRAGPIENPSRRVISEKHAKSIDSTKGKRSSNKMISIRFLKNGDVKHDDAVIDENHTFTPVDNSVPSSAAEEEESSPKTWNLRPRRPPMKHKHLNGGLPKIGSSPLPENRNSHGSNNANKESLKGRINDQVTLMTTKKQKFSIALSRDEIEEDIFSLTGLKPSKRPKKRPRSVQKQLDALFPGLWLGSITADSYKVSEPPVKG